MIEQFLTVLQVGIRLGVVVIEPAQVRARHRDVLAFSVEAVEADAQRLRAIVDRLAGADLRGMGSRVGQAWSGLSGTAAVAATRFAAGQLVDVVAEISRVSGTLDAAAGAAKDVLIRYRRAMTTVSRPDIAGVELAALPHLVAVGAVSAEVVRDELLARLQYADAAAQIASRALTDIAALVGEPVSVGELVLAGDR